MESSAERPLRELGVCSVTEKQVQSSVYMRPVRGASLFPPIWTKRMHFPTKKEPCKQKITAFWEGVLVWETNIPSTVHGDFQMICRNPPWCSVGCVICSEGTLHLQRLHPSCAHLCAHLRRELAVGDVSLSRSLALVLWLPRGPPLCTTLCVAVATW